MTLFMDEGVIFYRRLDGCGIGTDMTQKNMRQFEGILFDYDGVLADTMDDNFRAWNQALGVFNAAISADDFFPLEGMPVTRMVVEICRMTSLDVGASELLLRQKDAYYRLRKECILYPGVQELIAELHHNAIPFGIVSGGRRERIEASVPQALLQTFHGVVTAESTERGKPFPDPYLAGAQLLNIDIAKTIVVENAPLGIQAAKSAGAYCIAITSTVGKEKLTEADDIVESFLQLCENNAIRELIGKK